MTAGFCVVVAVKPGNLFCLVDLSKSYVLLVTETLYSFSSICELIPVFIFFFPLDQQNLQEKLLAVKKRQNPL